MEAKSAFCMDNWSASRTFWFIERQTAYDFYNTVVLFNYSTFVINEKLYTTKALSLAGGTFQSWSLGEEIGKHEALVE